MKLSEVIKTKRKTLKLSVKDVVDKLSEYGIEVSDKTIYGWENGHRQPNADTFLTLCDIYQIENITEEFGLKNISGTGNPLVEADDILTISESQLIQDFRQLNEEGQEKLLDYADDLVSTGKYIKSNTLELGTKEA